MKNLLIKLCKLNGVSGNENAVSIFAAHELKKYTNYIQTDINGNVIANMGNLNSSKHIMIDAHIDQIGLIVTNITKEGFLKVSNCGGIDPRILIGAIVKIHGAQEIIGIVCSIPPHLSQTGKNKPIQISDIFIDTNLSKEKINSIVSIGDLITFNSEPKIMLNNRISASSLDNRAGICALLTVAKLLSEIKINCKVSIVFSVQEETNACGAKTSTYKISPDEAIIVDVSFADQPSVPNDKTGILSNGPMIGISPFLSKEMYQKMSEIAIKKNILHQKEIMNGRTGTNADVIGVSKKGVKTALISIPERYMHTPVELVDIKDIENTAKLIVAYIINSSTNLDIKETEHK